MYTVYKTTNLKTGRYYIGVHKTDNPNDSYLGSGTLLKKAIEKYGVDSFQKEILFTFESPEEAFAKEYELLQHHLGIRECYNLKQGGNGGWKFVHQNGLTNKNKTKEHYIKMGRAGQIAHEKRRIDDAEYNANWLKKIHHPQTEETKQKIRDSLKGRKRNKVWITDGVVNKFHDAEQPIPDGFRYGRIV